MPPRIKVNKEIIEDFCRRWMIKEMALFGSVLRDDFDEESDVDILISFYEDIRWSLFDWIEMTDELKEITGREVDLVEIGSLRNPFRRSAILSQKEVIYAT